ncbi:MAG: leucine-rich repeat domain-containing protein [Pirellulaceae bacterium]
MAASPKRHWYQFSLRTLLGLMAAVAVLGGLFSARWNRAQRQAAFVNHLRWSDDAHYDYEVFMDRGPTYPVKHSWDDESPYPLFLRQWLSKDFFHSVVCIELWDPSHDAKERLRTLERMRIDLPDLRRLWVYDYATTKDIEQIVRISSLRSLDFTFLDIEGKDISALARATQLEDLSIWTQSLSDDEIRPLMSLTHLSRLSILATQGDQSASLAGEWLTSFSRLEDFDAQGLPLDNRAAKHLATLTKLKCLRLEGARVDDAALADLATLTQLEELDLSQTRITDAGLKHLTGLTGLKRLSLNRTAITDLGITHLAGMNRLEALLTPIP